MSATNITNTIKAAVESGDVNELQRLISGASVPHLMIPACALKGPQFVTAQVQGKTPEQKLQVLSGLLVEIAQERSSSRTETPPFTPDAPAVEKPKAGRGRPRKDAQVEDNVSQAPSASVEIAPDLAVLLQNISENVARIGNHLTQIESRIVAIESRVGSTQAEVAAIRQDLHAQAQFLGLVG